MGLFAEIFHEPTEIPGEKSENRANTSPKGPSFHKLSPIDDMKEMETYEKALDYALDDKDIRNIAVTGSYGSGKSSVVRTYFNRLPVRLFSSNEDNNAQLYQYCNPFFISLSRFEGRDGESEYNEISREALSARLEAEIINQIVQRANPKQIRYSKFSRGNDDGWGNTPLPSLGVAVLAAILFVTIAYLAFPRFRDLLSISDAIQPFATWIAITLALISGVSLACFAFESIRQHNKLSSVSIADKLAVSFKEHDKNPEQVNRRYLGFNDYLDEVLYLFRHAGSKVFIFEDIDRFDNIEIFNTLRNINYVLNSKSNSHTDKATGYPIKFIYLVYDSLFESEDRVKFFDFVIPVVPYLTSHNSYPVLKTRLEQTAGFVGLKYNVSDKILKNLSLYIIDPRIMNNVVNEFCICGKYVLHDSRAAKVFLALILYKNLFPADYELLLQNRGVLYSTLTHQNPTMREECLSLLSAKDFPPEALDEVKKAFEILGSFSDNQPIKDYFHNRILRSLIQTEMNDSLREQIMGYIRSNQKNPLPSDNNSSNMMVDYIAYTIQEGYIDESYLDFISYLHGEGLAERDRRYIQGIHRNVYNGQGYILKSPDEVLNYLSEEDCKKHAVINSSLLAYLSNPNSRTSLPSIPHRYARLILDNCLRNNWMDDFIRACLDDNRIMRVFSYAGLNTLEMVVKEIVNHSDTFGYGTKQYLIFALHLSLRLKQNRTPFGAHTAQELNEKREELHRWIQEHESFLAEVIDTPSIIISTGQSAPSVPEEEAPQQTEEERVEVLLDLIERAGYRIENLSEINHELFEGRYRERFLSNPQP